MRRRRAATILLMVQLMLVLSVGGKYLYERKVCPRVWDTAAQFDPENPFRGRYLALQLLVDACSLPAIKPNTRQATKMLTGKSGRGFWTWNVSLGVDKGRLFPEVNKRFQHPEDARELILHLEQPCEKAALTPSEEYFIPESAKPPFPLKSGEETMGWKLHCAAQRTSATDPTRVIESGRPPDTEVRLSWEKGVARSSENVAETELSSSKLRP